MIPSTTERVLVNTPACVNESITKRTRERVLRTASEGSPAIERRLHELDEEWDIERMLEAQAATASLTGLFLGTMVNRKFLLIPALIGGFLLQHAVQGWCPPLPILRRLGFRTQSEIEQERYALKALRGDFREVQNVAAVMDGLGVDKALSAVRT
jgi:hypothetical protein